MPIPRLNGNGVLPPYDGDPSNQAGTSPYPATTLELCKAFGTTLGDEVDEQSAAHWNLHLTDTHTIAKPKRLTVSTRTGDKKPSYELLGLKASGRLPAKTSNTPKDEPPTPYR